MPSSASLVRLAGSLAAAPLCCLMAATAIAAESTDIRVDGQVRQPLRLSRAQVAAMPAAHLGASTTTREVDGQVRSTTVRGVRLRALLEQAGLAEHDRFDWRKTVVVATARDGYRVVFSWPEIFNTEGGAQVLVVHERDGQALGPADGPLALVAAGDLRSGPRHVRGLERIEVRILRE
jgi:DMSO/TMAO reductase YedYZ molybdopterin-dependent catalytic subunit